jgi:hypothetical protein
MSLEDSDTIIIGHCNMMADVTRLRTEEFYGFISLRQLLDHSLAPIPTQGNIHIWTVHGVYQRFTVSQGIYLPGIASNTCTIQWPIHGSDVWYIEAYFCRWCGKWLEECDSHEDAKWLSGRVKNDKFRRVFRLPRVDRCQTPLYRSPAMVALHERFLEGLEPSQEEIDKKFNDTYVNDIREHHSITQQFSGVGMLPLNWTQTPAAMMPPNSIVDRRCNWDTHFVYGRHYYDNTRRFRLRHFATYAGLLPSHDTLVFEDFDQEVKHLLKWAIEGAEPAYNITRFVEVVFCPNGHMDPNRHRCGWCDELTMREEVGSFIPGTILIRISRNVHRFFWIEAIPPRDPQTDDSGGPSVSSSEEDSNQDPRGDTHTAYSDDNEEDEEQESKITGNEEAAINSTQTSGQTLSASSISGSRRTRSIISDIFGDSDDEEPKSEQSVSWRPFNKVRLAPRVLGTTSKVNQACQQFKGVLHKESSNESCKVVYKSPMSTTSSDQPVMETTRTYSAPVQSAIDHFRTFNHQRRTEMIGSEVKCKGCPFKCEVCSPLPRLTTFVESEDITQSSQHDGLQSHLFTSTSPPDSPKTPAYSPTYFGGGDCSPIHDDSPEVTRESEAESKRHIRAMLDEFRSIRTLPRVFEILPDDFTSTTDTQNTTQLDTIQMQGHEVQVPHHSVNTTTVVMPPACFPQGSVDCNGKFHDLHMIRKSELCDCCDLKCTGSCDQSDNEVHFQQLLQ